MDASNEPAAGTQAKGGSIATFLRSPVVAVVFTMFCWACTTIVVRYVRDDIPPFGLAFWRNLAAFFFILPFAIGAARRQWDIIRENLLILSVLAALLWVGGNALLFLALQYTIAINAALINSVEPVFIILLAALIFRDTLSRLQAVGVAASLLGVLILISRGSFGRLLELELNIGDVIVTVAYVAWGLYAVLLRKAPRGLDPAAMLLTIVGLGALFMFPLYVAETALGRPMHFDLMTLAVVAGLALFSCALAMWTWNYAITEMGPIRAGQYLHLIPAFTVALAILLLGEQLGMFHLVGAGLIAAGIYVTSKG